MAHSKTRCKKRDRVDYSRLLRCLQNSKDDVPICKGTVTNTDIEQDKPLHRILSDENVVYLYQKADNIIHDKHCKIAQSLELKDMEGMKTYDFGAKQCPCCEMQAYLRIGAEDYKKYKRYEELFEKMKVDASFIRKLYIEMKCKTKLTSLDTIHILHGEQMWKIRLLNGRGRVELLHNDYRLSYYGECTRFNTYHIQRENADADYALEVIAEYKKHRAYCEYTTEEQQVIRLLRKNPKATVYEMTYELGMSVFKVTDAMKSLIASETIIAMEESDSGWKVTM